MLIPCVLTQERNAQIDGLKQQLEEQETLFNEALRTEQEMHLAELEEIRLQVSCQSAQPARCAIHNMKEDRNPEECETFGSFHCLSSTSHCLFTAFQHLFHPRFGAQQFIGSLSPQADHAREPDRASPRQDGEGQRAAQNISDEAARLEQLAAVEQAEAEAAIAAAAKAKHEAVAAGTSEAGARYRELAAEAERELAEAKAAKAAAEQEQQAAQLARAEHDAALASHRAALEERSFDDTGTMMSGHSYNDTGTAMTPSDGSGGSASSLGRLVRHSGEHFSFFSLPFIDLSLPFHRLSTLVPFQMARLAASTPTRARQ